MTTPSTQLDASMAASMAQQADAVERALKLRDLRKNLEAEKDPKKELMKACQGFETIFIQKMWEQMRNNVPKEGYLHSKEESMYQGMYDYEFSKKMASAGGIGLSDMLYDQLSQKLGDSSRTVSPGVSPRAPVVPFSSSPSKFHTEGGEKALTQPFAIRSAELSSPQYEAVSSESGVVAALPEEAAAKVADGAQKNGAERQVAKTSVENVVLVAGRNVATVLPPQEITTASIRHDGWAIAHLNFEEMSQNQLQAERDGKSVSVVPRAKKAASMTTRERNELSRALQQSALEMAVDAMAGEQRAAALAAARSGGAETAQAAVSASSNTAGSSPFMPPRAKLVGSVAAAESMAREEPAQASHAAYAARIVQTESYDRPAPNVEAAQQGSAVTIGPAQPAQARNAAFAGENPYPTFRITSSGVQQTGGAATEPAGSAVTGAKGSVASSVGEPVGTQARGKGRGAVTAQTEISEKDVYAGSSDYQPYRSEGSAPQSIKDQLHAGAGAMPPDMQVRSTFQSAYQPRHPGIDANATRVERISYNEADRGAAAKSQMQPYSAQATRKPFGYFRRSQGGSVTTPGRNNVRDDV